MALPAVESEQPLLGLSEIRLAATRLQDAILRTPAVEAPKLSALSAARIFVKYENMQATGSFK
ncbi:MAG: threonine ammonia-lyase, partial [Rhodomicrobium sp.]